MSQAWRVAGLSGVAALLMATGCGGGGGGMSSFNLPQSSAGTGSMTLSMRVAGAPTGVPKGPGNGPRPPSFARQKESLLLLSATTAVIDVVSQGTTTDVVPEVTVHLDGQESVTVTISNIPPGTDVVDVSLLNSAGNPIGQGTSQTVTIAANQTAAATAQVTVTPTGGISTAMVASHGTPQLTLFSLTPAPVPVSAFVSPTLNNPREVVVSPHSFGASSNNTVFYVATGQTIVPVSVNPTGAATALATFTANGNVTGMDASEDSDDNPVLYVTTDASANNVIPLATNADGSLGAAFTTATVGSSGNTPDGVLVLFNQETSDSFIYVTSNGANTQNLTAFSMDDQSNIESGTETSLTLPDSPINITFPVGENPALYVITNGTTANVQSISILTDANGDTTTMTALNSATLPPTLTAATVITEGANNFLYGTSDTATNNVTPVPLSAVDGSLQTPLASVTAGGGTAGTPVAASADFTGSVPFLFVATNGTLQNFSEFPLNADGSLGTAVTATAGANPTSAVGL